MQHPKFIEAVVVDINTEAILTYSIDVPKEDMEVLMEARGRYWKVGSLSGAPVYTQDFMPQHVIGGQTVCVTMQFIEYIVVTQLMRTHVLVHESINIHNGVSMHVSINTCVRISCVLYRLHGHTNRLDTYHVLLQEDPTVAEGEVALNN